MAGGSDDVVDAVGRYGAELGLAFQIVDDILDIEGENAQLGKTAGKDAADRKPTYPALFGLDRSRQMADECVARAVETLADARLTDGWLPAIAGWVVERRN
jgi:geranylgeranyl pyrophosphate synthase